MEENTENKTVEPIEEKPIVEEVITEPFDSEAFRTGKEVTPKELVEKKPVEEKKEEPIQTQLDDYWSSVQEVLGEDYPIPEVVKTGKKEDGTELSKKEKFELLANEIAKNVAYSDNPQVDSFLRSIAKASKAEGFDLSKHLDTLKNDYIDPSSMSLDDKVKYYYKENFGKIDENDKDGLSDEDITDEISKLSRTEKIKYSREFDKFVNDRLSKQEILYQKQHNEKIDKVYQQILQEDNKLLENYINKAKIGRTIDGIELSQEDYNVFLKEAPDFYKKQIKKNKEGYSYVTSEVQEILADILGSPDKSMSLMPFLWLYKNKKLGSYTNQIKEDVKRKIESNLSPEPKVNQDSYTGEEFDAKAFREGK